MDPGAIISHLKTIKSIVDTLRRMKDTYDSLRPSLTEVITRFEAIHDLLEKSKPKPEVATKVFDLIENFCKQADAIVAALQKQLKGGALKKLKESLDQENFRDLMVFFQVFIFGEQIKSEIENLKAGLDDMLRFYNTQQFHESNKHLESIAQQSKMHAETVQQLSNAVQALNVCAVE